MRKSENHQHSHPFDESLNEVSYPPKNALIFFPQAVVMYSRLKPVAVCSRNVSIRNT